jgi:hypothetical protein
MDIIADVLKSFESLDIDELENAYKKRREDFLEVANSEHHINIRKPFMLAVSFTDLGMSTFQDYIISLNKYLDKFARDMEEERIKIEEPMQKIINITEEFRKNIGSPDNLSESQKRLILEKQSALDIRVQAIQDASDKAFSAREATMDSLGKMHIASFETLMKIYSEKDLSVLGDLVTVFVKNLVGLIPILGNISGLVLDLNDVRTKYAEQLSGTSEQLKSIDVYIHAVTQWCVVTQFVIEINEGNIGVDLGETDIEKIKSKIFHENAVEMLLQRFKNRIEQSMSE